MILPQVDYQTTKIAPPEPLHQNLDRAVNQLLGRFKRLPARIKYWQQQAKEIIAQSLQLHKLGAEELTDRLLRVKAVCRRKGGEVPEQTVIEAFSLIAEASERSLGIRPYTVQILAALALQHGYLAEMATGEGKTLTAAFPAILTAWSAQPCHIVTANDYLAQRDAEELSPLYTFCAVTTGWIEGKMDSSERRHNYRQGVVYTTGKSCWQIFYGIGYPYRVNGMPPAGNSSDSWEPCSHPAMDRCCGGSTQRLLTKRTVS